MSARSLFFATLLGFALVWGPRTATAQQTLITGDTIGTSGPYKETVRRYLLRQEPKIVGGRKAPHGAFPWQVSVGVSWISDPYESHFCGGSIYSRTWIVTAAHCLEGLAPEKVTVTAGTHALGVGGVRVNARRLVVKSDYNRTTFDNDIAMIELMDPLPFGQNITPISLLEPGLEAETLREDAPLVVIGWGSTQEGGSVVRDLRYANILFVTQTICNGPIAYDGRITENMVCAGVPAGGMDSCQGDSGGPLTASANGAMWLAGIVSWGEGCARPNKFGVYTRSAKYGAWVGACVAKPDECR